MPTTLLAQQHLATFSERMSPSPVSVGAYDEKLVAAATEGGRIGAAVLRDRELLGYCDRCCGF